jgi:GTP-binding protein
MVDPAAHAAGQTVAGSHLIPAQSSPQEADAAALEAGRLLFAAECQFFFGAQKLDQLPPLAGTEIAFAGRSNVGKSSLLNALTGRNSLARTSSEPGRTRQLNFFNLGDRLTLVDMPGYGYARASKDIKADWQGMMFARPADPAPRHAADGCADRVQAGRP